MVRILKVSGGGSLNGDLVDGHNFPSAATTHMGRADGAEELTIGEISVAMKRARAVTTASWHSMGVDLGADDLGKLIAGASAAHRRMWEAIRSMTDADCSAPSLLPGWSRAHVLTHWARNADGQHRMLAAAMRDEVADQYPGGETQRSAEIQDGCSRAADAILADARAAMERVEEMWHSMPTDAWSRPTLARAGRRPAWMSVLARWRETDIHHLDLDLGYTHRHLPIELVDLLLPKLLPDLACRLPESTAVQVRITDRASAVTRTAESDGSPIVVSGPASASRAGCWVGPPPLRVISR